MPQNKGAIPWNKGIPQTEETKKKLSESLVGREPNEGSFKPNEPSWNKGKKGIYSEETLRKMSEAKKGKPSWNKGKKLSEEHRKNLSEAHKGQPSHMKGKTHTPETKEKISETRSSGNYAPWNKGKKGEYSIEGHPQTEESIKKISKSRKGILPWNKGIPLSEEHCLNLSVAAVYRCTGKESPFYLTGKTYGEYCEKFSLNLRRRVRAFFDNTCLLCGKTTEENKEELCVHHVYAEKLSCCESQIQEMEEIRELFPPEIARFGEPMFSPEEITRIRMMAPLCRKCHAKTIFWNVTAKRIMKELDHIIMTYYGGRCYFERDEFAIYLKAHALGCI